VTEPHALRDYAFIADGERGALVGPEGDIAWMCFPRWHSDGLFSELIGGTGTYAVRPRGRCVWGGYYERGSLIWRSRWVTAEGIVECREALALPSRRDRAVVLRRIGVVAGRASLSVQLAPGAEFGKAPRAAPRLDGDAWAFRTGEIGALWSGAADARVTDDDVLELSLDLEEGDEHDLVLVLEQARDPGRPPSAEDAWRETEAGWAERVPELEETAATREARQAVAVLHGLTSSTGAMVAAATTSLPERAREGRNYDYRYAWVRDQCYAGEAAAAAGVDGILDAAVRVVAGHLLEYGPELRPAYTVDGGPIPAERSLDLLGYPGGCDVVGNRASDQFQLDAFGEALLLLAAAAGRDRLDADGRRAAALAADTIARRHREPDSGIWELEPARWTHSRLICAGGLRAMSGAIGGRPEWDALADTLVAEAVAWGLHPSGRWQRAAGDDRVDAALLTAGIRGAVPLGDPRTRATIDAVERELTEDGLAYRYRIDDRPPGESEGAFLVCGLWMALAWNGLREPVRATRWFERARAACGGPGIYAEEYDVAQRQLRGNLPQAFVHALVLECAATLP
jgi:GH15 family glucan-1,4-alpha-glucosidase